MMSGFQFTTDMELAVLIAVVLLGVILLMVLGRRQQPGAEKRAAPDVSALRDEVRDLKGRMGEFEHDLKQVRTMMGALPTKDSVHQIALQVTELKGDLKVNSTETSAIALTVEKIMTWLMDEAKKKKAPGE